MLLQAAAIALVAAGTTFGVWATAQVLLGIGTALVYPTLLAVIGDVAHPAWRARAVGVYRLWRDGGFAVAPSSPEPSPTPTASPPPSGPSPPPPACWSRYACTRHTPWMGGDVRRTHVSGRGSHPGHPDAVRVRYGPTADEAAS
ncbi:hypothetical protein [Streptomyces sp. NEAU-W12]|uniref:hypothetical protein n=1 Tax=Streptomyces sp. NEAU-W12 TaxID=2994668 RepID=UPI00224AA17A|nr:hypothetical protein [Streptomyces sp. NEAU-W12]MCX2926565.1 hypothetical protein [Streptomyces sp. NEAU-W12]